MVEWFNVPENFSVVHFAIENGISKEELFRLAGDHIELQEALDYGMSVQEYKVMQGTLTGALDKTVGLKMLETYSGWKGDINFVQRNEYKQFMNEASEKAKQILSDVNGDVGYGRGGVVDDDSSYDGGDDVAR